MSYAYPTNVTNLTSWFLWSNTVTSGWFSTAIIFIAFVVAFLSMKGFYPTHKAYAGASFLALVMAIFFFVIGIISVLILVVAIVMVITGVIWLWFADKQEY